MELLFERFLFIFIFTIFDEMLSEFFNAFFYIFGLFGQNKEFIFRGTIVELTFNLNVLDIL